MQIITNQFQKELKSHGNYQFPFLVSYEKLSSYESGSFPWHWHPEIELTLVTKGQMIYKVNRNIFHLQEGQALFGNSNTLHSGYMESQADCTYISVTFDPKLIYGFPHSIISQKYVEPITQDFALSAIHFDGSSPWHQEIISSIQSIACLDREKPVCFELTIIMELQSIWRTLYLYHTPTPAASAHEQAEYNRIKEILSYLEQHYTEKISLSDISSHIHLCESECCRIFKHGMNVSLFTFLQEYRIERSIEYLSDPTRSITEIAAMTGFADSNYYSKVFVKLKGCSPREYRKRYCSLRDQ